MPYAYPHFQRELLEEDSSFHGGPRPGEPFPDFDLPTTDRGRLCRSHVVGRRPMLMTFSSITCPMTADASSILRPLYEEFGEQIAFVSLYVREAHPGENYPQPETMEEKIQHARDYKQRDLIPWTVAVDDLEGSLHRALDPRPNAAYLVDTDGRVFARILWSNDHAALSDALAALLAHEPLHNPERINKAVPMLRGMGVMDEVLGAAGQQARKDFRRALPPIYGMARLAALYRGLPTPARSIAAAATLLCAATLAGAGAWRILKRSHNS